MEYIFFKLGLPAVTAFSLLFSWQSAVLPLKEPVVESKIEQVQIIEVKKESMPTPKLSTQRIIPRGDCSKYEALITSYDWPDETAMQVCSDESDGIPHAVGDRDTEYVSCGLMQIRTLPGRPTCEELKDPITNIAISYKIWQEEGFCPWTVYKGQECLKK